MNVVMIACPWDDTALSSGASSGVIESITMRLIRESDCEFDCKSLVCISSSFLATDGKNRRKGF